MEELFLDFSGDISFSQGWNLPHLHQDGKLQFITFRLADSLPRHVTEQLLALKQKFLRDHPGEWTPQTKIEYHKLIGPTAEAALNNGYGSCVLRNPRIRAILEQAFAHYDNEACIVHAYVIMPNHVHVLLQMIGSHQANTIIHSIKSFTARAINKTLNRTGPLWLRDNFDRLIRSNPHYHATLQYIINNPSSLPPSDYTLYIKQ